MERLPGPMVFLQPLVSFVGLEAGCGRGLGPDGAGLDPLRKDADLVFGQLFLRGHFNASVDFLDGLDEEACLWISGEHRWPALASLDQAVAVVDAEPALRVGVGRVAAVAILDQQRPDFLLEEIHSRGIFIRGPSE